MISKSKKESISNKKNFKDKFILKVLFFGGFILGAFQIYIYRNTIIDWRIPTTIWICSGLIITPFIRKTLIENYNIKILFFQFIYSLIAFGGIFVFGFMSINFYSEKSNLHESKYEIVKKISTRREQIIVIKYNGKEKKLYFSKYKKIEVKNAKNVILQIKNGRLGFEVIENCKLN